MPNLYETDGIFFFPERLDHAIHSISGQAEDRIDIPILQNFNEYIRCRALNGHVSPPQVARPQFLEPRSPIETAKRSWTRGALQRHHARECLSATPAPDVGVSRQCPARSGCGS